MRKPDLLYLVHRIPFPPNKGDKLRSFHFLKYLQPSFNIHLGCFIDDPEDAKYETELAEYCESIFALPLSPLKEKLKSTIGILTGKALTLEYYSSAKMQSWVNSKIQESNIDKVLVSSSAMAQFVEGDSNLKRIIDFIDIDSDKWSAYSKSATWPLSWIYKREGKYLRKYENKIANEFDASFFVSEAEALLFTSNQASIKQKVFYVNNGVDYNYFSLSENTPSPFNKFKINIVFTGAMDYWPNIDAVCWFVENLLPAIQKAIPDLGFYIVGSNPSAQIKSLGSNPRIVVTGRVEDIRPYILYSDLVVATLRIARGVQNKVLEAMALNKPLLVTNPALEGIIHEGQISSFDVDDTLQMIAHVVQLLEEGGGHNICYRDLIEKHYDWAANTEKLRVLIND